MKHYSFLLTMLLCMTGATTFAHDIEAENSDGVTIYYVYINNTELAVSYRGTSGRHSNEYSGNVIIPESVTINGNTYPVTSISYGAFQNCPNLTSVTIPNSVTNIGSWTFYGCSGLTSVTILGSVTSIEKYTFYGCSGLTSVTIPDSVTSIGERAFNGCDNITLVKVTVTDYTSFCENKAVGLIYSNIGKPVQLINNDGTEIKEYVVPEGVTSIGSSAFCNCDSLTSITIPSSLTNIGDNAFQGCSNINTVKVPVTDYAAFCNNKALGCIYSSLGKPVQLINNDGTEIKEYVVPEGVTSIGSSAFRNCTGLTSVTIPGGLTSIGYHAFEGCSDLTSVTIGNSVTSIGYSAFSGCSTIITVKVPVTDYSAFCNNKVLGCIYSSIGKPVQLINNEGTEIKEYVVPEDVTSIGSSAFRNCTGLTSVTIASSVTSIGSSAFDGCI